MKSRLIQFMVFVFCFVSAGHFCHGGTVFVAERNARKVNVYREDDAVLSLQAIIDYGHDSSGHDATYGLGPIDVTADEAHDTLFVSFESRDSNGTAVGTPHILLINTRTLAIIDTVEVSQADDIGSLFFDAEHSILYGIERNSNILYEMTWEPLGQQLTFKKAVGLDNMEWACALRVDGDRAYISEYKYVNGMAYYNDIKEYSIADNWAFVRTISMGAAATCLGYDAQRGIFYSGAYDYNNTFHHFVKRAMDAGTGIVKDIGHNVTAADVDDLPPAIIRRIPGVCWRCGIRRHGPTTPIRLLRWTASKTG